MKLSNKQFFSKRPKGFTLVELLVVIGIIATLGAISYNPILNVLNNAQVTKSQKVCKDLVAAIDNFQLDYGYLPFVGSLPNQDEQLTTEDSDFLNVIMGIDTDVNTRGIGYFDADQSNNGSNDGLIVDGSGDPEMLVDKWGQPYYILLDYDGDGIISITGLLDPAPTGTNQYDTSRKTGTALALCPGKDGEFNSKFDSSSFQ